MHTSSDVKKSPEYGAIAKYLSGEVQEASQAVYNFGVPVEAKWFDTENPETVEESLWQAWRAVVTMAASIPYTSENRQKLADFTLDIRRTNIVSRDGQECVVQGGTVWKDLPIFGMEMREAWNLAATKGSTPEQKENWINLNAYTATLIARVQARDLPGPDLSLYCIWTVRMALEEEAPADVTLRAATMWFLYASPSIYELCLKGKTFDGKIAKPGFLFKDREWRGFSQDRWKAWMHRMEKAGELTSDGEVAKTIANAVAAMKAVDGASSRGK